MKWLKDRVSKQVNDNDESHRNRYLREVIDIMQDHGYANMTTDNPNLRKIIDGYYDAGIAPAGIPYYVGKYVEKDVIISWGADWSTVKQQYFRED
jgi:hypothetical protein